MPGTSIATKLTQQEACATVGRLARTPLDLPSSLFKQGDPTAEATEAYLAQLLDHDPASFLERYGKHLNVEELAAFAPLCHDYEVQFWVNSLQSTRVDATATTSGQSPRVSASTRNRRLAAMQQLHEAGEFFSEESMQERDPAMYHHYIGQFAEAEDEDNGQPQEEKANEEMVLRFQQSQLKARMEQLREEQMEEQMSEHESDDDSEEESAATAAAASMEVDAKPLPAQAPAPLKGPAIRGIPAGRLKSVPAAKPSGAWAEARGQQAAGTRSGATPLPLQQQQQQRQQQQKQQQQRQQPQGAAQPSSAPKPARPAAAAVRFAVPEPGPASQPSCSGRSAQRHGAKQDLEDNQRQFVQEMEARFLSGGDHAFVDYATIDANATLDDHWLEQRGRDAEDAYFDEDAAAERGDDGGMECRQAGAPARAEGEEEELEEWERMAMS